MKKLLALLLALVLCIGVFAACANETKDPVDAPVDEPTDKPEDKPTEPTDKPEDKPTEPTDKPEDKPTEPTTTKENYIVVANDKWCITTHYELTEDPKPATWVSGTSGLTGYQYGGSVMLAPEGQMCAVKLDKIAAYASGDIADEDIIYLEQADTEGKFVGTEVEIEFNADKTVKGFKATGKSVVGELTITKEGDKFTAKIGDKVFLDKADATAKLAEKAFDSVLASGYYVSSATKKAVFAFNSGENIDLQVVFGNESRDITTVGLFYDEIYNFNYEGGVDGFDWDGDGKLDLVVVNRPHTVKATADSDGTSASFGVLGDNHSYCGCGGWHTQSTVTGTIAAGIVKNDILFVYEDYKTGAYNVTKPEVIKAKLESVDIAAGKATIGGKTYNLYNAGDLPYLNGKAVTQYETEAQSALWNNSVGVEVSIIVDKLNNIIWAAQASEAQVVDAVWALEKGATLGTHTLTGKITSVDTPYSEQYKNITVTIVVGDKADKPIVCYRVKGEGVEGLAVGDTITLTGELLNYADSSEKGKVEFNANTVVTKIVKAEKPAEPDTPVTPPATHTHAWDAGKVTKAATCKEEGTKTFTCACGETKTEKIAKLTTHTFDAGKVTKEASCKEEGTKTLTCSVCGETKTESIAKTENHSYDEGKVTTQPTTSAEGVKTFTCTVCGKTKTEPVAKLAETLKPGLSKDGKTFVGVLDMTDYYTLVIEKVGQSGDARMGVRASEGQVQIAVYNATGKKRTEAYEVDFSILGVSGHPWEYLGATVVLDLSDEDNIKVVTPPKKTTYCVSLSEMTFPNSTTVKMPDGTEFNIAKMNWGGLTNHYLLNEGGQYIPGWNDTSIVNSSSGMFTNESFSSGYYLVCGCELYNETVMYGGLDYSLHDYPAASPNA